MGFWGCGLGGMEEIKKSGGGDVRAGALSRATIGIKPKTGFRFYLHSRPRWAASHPTHIPRRPKKKPLRGKKVGFAEKKLRLWGLAWAAGWVDIEGRAQNIAPLQVEKWI